MAERLGLGIILGAGWRAAEIRAVAREAEDAGFDAIFTAEVNNAEEAARAEAGAGGASLSDRLLDAICLIGPISRCREQLAAYRAAGVDLPILSPPIGVDGARDLIRAFRRLS